MYATLAVEPSKSQDYGTPLSSPHGCDGPSTWAIIHCICEMHLKSRDSNRHSNRWCGYLKQRLKLLCHNIHTNRLIFIATHRQHIFFKCRQFYEYFTFLFITTDTCHVYWMLYWSVFKLILNSLRCFWSAFPWWWISDLLLDKPFIQRWVNFVISCNLKVISKALHKVVSFSKVQTYIEMHSFNTEAFHSIVWEHMHLATLFCNQSKDNLNKLLFQLKAISFLASPLYLKFSPFNGSYITECFPLFKKLTSTVPKIWLLLRSDLSVSIYRVTGSLVFGSLLLSSIFLLCPLLCGRVGLKD